MKRTASESASKRKLSGHRPLESLERLIWEALCSSPCLPTAAEGFAGADRQVQREAKARGWVAVGLQVRLRKAGTPETLLSHARVCQVSSMTLPPPPRAPHQDYFQCNFYFAKLNFLHRLPRCREINTYVHRRFSKALSQRGEQHYGHFIQHMTARNTVLGFLAEKMGEIHGW